MVSEKKAAKYQLIWEEARIVHDAGMVHPSRMVKANDYHLNVEPFHENGSFYRAALFALLEAERFLTQLRRHLRRDLRELSRSLEMRRLNDPGEYGRKRIDPETNQISSGIVRQAVTLREDVAVVTEYIRRNHKEHAGIVEGSKARFDPYAWIPFIYNSEQDPSEYGLVPNEETGDLIYLDELGPFDPEKIEKLDEKQFQVAFDNIEDCKEDYNFAITSGSILVNFISYKTAEIEAGRIADDANENPDPIFNDYSKQLLDKEVDGGSRFLNRRAEINYRGRSYNLPVKLTIIEPEGCTQTVESVTNDIGLYFVERNCPYWKKDLLEAFAHLVEHGQSLHFEDDERDLLIATAKLYSDYVNAKATVQDWYKSRVKSVTDVECIEALELLKMRCDQMRISEKKQSLIIADQTLVREKRRQGIEIKKEKEVTSKMEAIEQYAPILEKFGLEIRPKSKWTIEHVTPNSQILKNLLSEYSSNITPLTFDPNFLNRKITEFPTSVEMPDFVSPTMGDVTQIKPEPPSNVEVEVIEDDAFDRYASVDKLVAEARKNSRFEGYRQSFPSAQCSYAQIGAAISDGKLMDKGEEGRREEARKKRKRYRELKAKESLTPEEKTEFQQFDPKEVDIVIPVKDGFIAAKSATNKGKVFVEKTDWLSPCKNGKTLTKIEAMEKALSDAVRKVKNLSGLNLPEQQKAVNSFKGEDDLDEKADTLFEKHLKRLGLTKKEDREVWIQKARNYEATKQATTHSLFNSDEVAAAMVYGLPEK